MRTFTIVGVPAPGGSKKAFAMRTKAGGVAMHNGRPIIRVVDAAGHRNTQWKAAVARSAKVLWQGPPLNSVLFVVVEIRVPRPRGHYRTGRYANELRDDAPAYPAVKPDATKLWRAIEDALTGIVWVDDALIVDQDVRKRYADASNGPGCTISVDTMEEMDSAAQVALAQELNR